MEIKGLIAEIKERFPDKAIDLSESLELLKETLNDTMTSVTTEISLSMSIRDFESVNNITQLAQNINHYEQKIDDLIDSLEIEELEENIGNDEVDEVEKAVLPDYTAYSVDTNVEHTLYENFTHKRPFAFRMNDHHMIEVKTWQELFIKTCELLIAVDEKKFLSFENKSSMNEKNENTFH